MPRAARALAHLILVFTSCATMSRSPDPSPAEPTSAALADAGVPSSAPPGGPGAAAPTRSPGPGSGTVSGGVGGGVSGSAAVSGGVIGGSDSRGADADFDAARGRFDRGDQPGARVALEGFVARHANHPNRPAAELLLARLALQRGDAATAKKLLDPTVAATSAAAPPNAPASAPANATPARYYLGLAELRLGNAARARALLSSFLAPGAADPAPTDDAAVELRGALAEATTAVDPIAGLELWEGYFRVAREHEQAWARARAGEIAARVSPEVAWRAFSAAPPSGLGRAVLGAKAATYLRSRGDATGAAFIENQTGDARHALGFDATMARIGPGDPTRIGLAIPLSGKFQVVGEAALRAAMLAGGAPGSGGGVGAGAASGGGMQLLVRDTATDPDRAARGVAELTRTEAVIGIIGAAGAKAGNAAVAQATQDGIPMMALQDSAPGALTTAFQIIHAPEARAAALARQALKLGVRRFAIVGPDSAAAKRLREAFRKAVTEGGGTIVAESTYVAGATSFAGAIGPLKKPVIEAIFVPDSAERLPLIAPALAVADLWPQPWSKPRGRTTTGKDQPRPVLLLSTASELSRKLVDSAGRYVQGALLCPGFFADDRDPRARGFVEAYRAAFGQDPHATEAYAYDAVAALRTTAQRGAHTRADVIKVLAGSAGAAVLQGLTGDITFGPDHGRTDSPYIYVVDGDDIHTLR